METMKESEPREGAHPRSSFGYDVSLHLGNFTVLLFQLDVAPAAAESEVF